MHLGLSNVGSSYCDLMKQCLDDPVIVPLVQYLDRIYISVYSICDVVNHIEMVFGCSKLNPKNITFYNSVFFLGHFLLAYGIFVNSKR